MSYRPPSEVAIALQLKLSKVSCLLSRQMYLPGERSPGGLPLILLSVPTLVATGSISSASDLQHDIEQNSSGTEKRA